MTATSEVTATTAKRGLFVSKTGPLAFMALGVIGAVVAIGWAFLVWHFDELISPRGQIVVGVTTPCVMFFFGGLLAYWRANDRERNADLPETLRAIPALLKAMKEEILSELKAELATQAADLASDHARRELRLTEKIERLQDQLSQVTLKLTEVDRLCRPQPRRRPSGKAAASVGAQKASDKQDLLDAELRGYLLRRHPPETI